MQIGTRRILIGVAAAGVIGLPMLLAGYLSLGLIFAPAWPVPATAAVPTQLADALWARAGGGPATSINPFNPINLAEFAFCVAQAEPGGPGPARDAAQAECQKEHVPGFGAIEYMSELHMRSAGFNEPGFRKGHAKFVTTIWLARSWSKAELIRTLAERGEFGMGFRGLEAAAQGYFGRAAAELSLPQAAMVAGFAGGTGPDPWCDPGRAAGIRHRILATMHDDRVIGERELEIADRSELALTARPAGHQLCLVEASHASIEAL